MSGRIHRKGDGAARNLGYRSAQVSLARRVLCGAAGSTLAALLAVPGVPGVAVASTSSPTASAGLAAAADAAVPMPVEQAVDRLGRRDYPATYGGMAVVNNRTQIAVYLTDPNPQTEASFQQVAAPAGMLVFHQTPRSLQSLTAIDEQLTSQWNSLVKSGIDVVELGPNILTGREGVGVEALTLDQRATLETLYGHYAVNGTSALNVFAVSVASLPQPLATRTNDLSPYDGGDAISHYFGPPPPDWQTCTSNFGVRIDGSPRFLTAGHCFDVGDDIVNLRCPLPGHPGPCVGGEAKMGTETADRYVNGDHLDAAVITGCNAHGTCGGDDLIFLGPPNASTVGVVSGVASWHIGDQVCYSGARTGENCGFVVQQVNYKFKDADGVIIYHVTRTRGTSEPEPGDSGAPVYRFSSGEIYAAGILEGGARNDIMYFTGINVPLHDFGATLITG